MLNENWKFTRLRHLRLFLDMLELALDRQRHYNLFMIQFGAMNCRCRFYRKQDTVDVEYDFEVDAIFLLCPMNGTIDGRKMK